MTETILYLDPWSGISGDMFLAALLDADRTEGRLEAELQRTVAGLGLQGVTVEVLRGVERGVSCSRVQVEDRSAPPLRHLADMERLIEAAPLTERTRTGAIEAVRRLALVEAEIHGCAVEEIHFHEVGAADTLIDVVGAFALVEALGVDRVIVGTIPVGGGTVDIAHGRMGVPAPATARLLRGYDIVGGPEAKELTTPTGALILTQLNARQGSVPHMQVEKIGYGAGSMKLEKGPNVLRAMIGVARAEPGQDPHADELVVELQTNLDDVSPEIVGHTVRLLRQAGALDVWTLPAHMKKERPGVVVHALVKQDEEAAFVASIFEQTGTLGVRRQVVSRHVATRGTVTVAVAGAPVAVKWGRWQGRLVAVAPEYDEAAAAASAAGLPLREVMYLAEEAARQLLGASSTGPGA